MNRRFVAALLLVLGSLGAGAVTYAFNDKGLISHNGRVICVDWHAWTEHRLHGDPTVGDFPYTCDTPGNK